VESASLRKPGLNPRANMFSRAMSLAALVFACAQALAQRPELVLQTGHPGGPSSIAFSPDSKFILSTGSDATVQLWEVATGRGLRTVRAFINAAPAFAADGRTMMAGDASALKIWDIATGRELRTLRLQNPSNAIGVSFSPDRRIYATGGDDMVVRLWDTSTGKLIRALPSSPLKIYALAFSPDGKTIVGGGLGKALKVWNVESGAPLTSIPGSGTVYSIDFNADGTRIASCGADKTVSIWDVRSRALVQTLRGHTAFVNRARFSPDGKTLASSASHETIRIWHTGTGALIRVLTHEAPIAFSPDGSLLAVRAGSDITLLNASTGLEVRNLRGRTE
jgi:hypothetical protein